MSAPRSPRQQRPGVEPPIKDRPTFQMRPRSRAGGTAKPLTASAIVGGILVALAALWLLWLMINHFGVGPGLSTFPLPMPGLVPAANTTPVAQVEPLRAAGITLGTPHQEPTLTQQQALLLANQLEPSASVHAGQTSAQYVLLNYMGTQITLRDTPAWLIHYAQVPVQPADTSADPTAKTTQHDLYVLLDANSGKELFSIWV